MGSEAQGVAEKPRRGRPNRLSRDAILEAACAVAIEQPLRSFSLARVAERLNAGVMSLYTYFPSRESLLTAVGDEFFGRFQPPAQTALWQDEMRGWLWAMVRHLDAHPVALQLAVLDGRISPGWLRTWLPLARRMRAEGLDGSRLAFAMNWFSNAAMGFIASEQTSVLRRQDEALALAGALPDADRTFAVELWGDLKGVERDAALAFGFENLIRGMEALIGGEAPAPQQTEDRSEETCPTR